MNPGWVETTGQALAADAVESWDLLTYTRPRTLPNRTDPAVTDRSADYRLPDNLSIGPGSPWNDPDQNTASDHFNEAEGAYTLTFDPALGLTVAIDGVRRRAFPLSSRSVSGEASSFRR